MLEILKFFIRCKFYLIVKFVTKIFDVSHLILLNIKLISPIMNPCFTPCSVILIYVSQVFLLLLVQKKNIVILCVAQ